MSPAVISECAVEKARMSVHSEYPPEFRSGLFSFRAEGVRAASREFTEVVGAVAVVPANAGAVPINALPGRPQHPTAGFGGDGEW
ncbi:hypothetical protein MTQ01_23710 [Streptomyces sp. XM4193]|uniref:hypothetical protein n=1 Tax=Streptomyces sp. XM4193 TaxID=2929782 RepID=UPI001FF967E3|nr:hypothetical protein [Streptomyces sp. XM4193]MCK1798980.1 hypothetical protein [Streptomyces sp. XM4193]